MEREVLWKYFRKDSALKFTYLYAHLCIYNLTDCIADFDNEDYVLLCFHCICVYCKSRNFA